MENMEKPLKIMEKPFGRLGRTEGDPAGDRSLGGVRVTLMHQATRPGTPFSYRKRKLAKARVTAASYASFREYALVHTRVYVYAKVCTHA